ncbi:MAG: thioredoxin family protein [Planctomycetes bacterium]|nr:thioredoxin family protein [Planctomycetota bacterium]
MSIRTLTSALRATAATVLLSALSLAGGAGWVADYDEAVKLAKAEKKDLFVDFTGSDWCGWCIKLNEEVFAHDAFLNEIKKDYILVALDYPRGEEAKKKVPNEKRNAELSKLHGIQGFPTILLMTPDGVAYGQTGYQKGGPEAYVTHVKELRTKGRADVDRYRGIADAWRAATGDAKGTAWDELAKTFEADQANSRAATVLVGPIQEALTFDADNKQGRKLRALQVLLAAGRADEAMIAAARALDPKNEKGLLERVVMAQFESVQNDELARAALTELDQLVAHGPRKDKKIDFMLHVNAAYFCSGPLQEPERAKKYAKVAKEIGSDDERAMQLVEQILGS